MNRQRLGQPTIRVALFVGFGLVVGVWLFAGYHFTRRIADVERRAASVSALYMKSQELLSTIRAQVLLGSVYVRDALLDPDPTLSAGYRRQLLSTYDVIDAALLEYVPVVDTAADQEQMLRLRREIDDFKVTMLDAMGNDSTQWPRDVRTLLRTRVVPKRELVFALSEEIQSLNRSAFVQQQSAMADIYRATQRQVWQSLSVALGATLVIALLATAYAGWLEDRIRAQRANEVQTARDLQELSAKLISAQEDERRSIARELHDEVGQVLTAIKVELAVAERTLGSTGGPAGILADARSIADGALQTVRDLSQGLHPALLDDLGLRDAVEWYLRGFGRRHGIRVEVLHDRMDIRLTSEIEASAYRIVQEALTNVAKHSRAATCRVYLQRLPHTMLITVEDDGAGFDPAAAGRDGARRGLGLLGIRERASHLGGTVRVESAPGKGTRITVELPARERVVAVAVNA